MTDNNDKPEPTIVPGGDSNPEKRDTTQEDAENKARHDALFGDLDDEEEETPEEIKAQRNVMWKKVADMEVRLDVYQQDKLALTAKLDGQKAQSELALAKIRDAAETEKAVTMEAFVKEALPVADHLGQNLGAIAKETRAADPKFDKLIQGVEKTLIQLTTAFNKSGGKTTAPKDINVKTETAADAEQKTPAPKERIIREDETPEEIKSERDLLVRQQMDLAGKLGKAQQDVLSLTKQIAAQKTEAEQALVRAQNQINEQKAFALEKFVKDLLPAVDNLERGLSVIPAVQRAADAKFETLAQDVEKTLDSLAEAFNKFGIKAVNPKGEAFDPEKHEAISTDDSADVESDTVVSVAQKGYTLNDRVIRTAKVVVKP
ncbi:MAG: nucleotide exchange factor GrpE [Alphaproteobacteria bacterium]|nr:nucleotide exchange factor GrpE [Alphaproteobacteria bacterium]